jgi:hypothetical protein
MSSITTPITTPSVLEPGTRALIFDCRVLLTNYLSILARVPRGTSNAVSARRQYLSGVDCGLDCSSEVPERLSFLRQRLHSPNVEPIWKTTSLSPAFQEELKAFVSPVFVGRPIVDDRNHPHCAALVNRG